MKVSVCHQFVEALAFYDVVAIVRNGTVSSIEALVVKSAEGEEMVVGENLYRDRS